MIQEGEKCPACEGKLILVEYPITDPNHYDGISEIACVNALNGGECRYRRGRFCGKPLASKESEPPFCTGESHPMHA